jgi:lysozyme family protein
MTPFFLKLFDHIILVEGGYGNHPSDPGGKTKYGITEETARRNGYTGAMRDLPLEKAKSIYWNEYFVNAGLEKIAELSEPIAQELFDSGVNAGIGRASLWLQQALNVMNKKGELYGDIKEDRAIGKGTASALKAYLQKRGPEAEKVMLRTLNGLQLSHYFNLCRDGMKFEDFMYGWVRTRVS